MQYDDRLATVLRPKVGGVGSARIQYHQLLDLLGTSPTDARGELLDAAYSRLAELSQVLPASQRVAMLGEPALRLRSPRLVAVLGGDEPEVAGAAVRAAKLNDEQWLDLIPALPPAARAAMRGRRDIGAEARALLARLGVGDLGLPQVSVAPAATGDPGPEPLLLEPTAAVPTVPQSSPEPDVGIGAIVRRIEAFRRARDEAGSAVQAGDSPRLPLGEETNRAAAQIRGFDFGTDGAGRICWSEARVTPMVVGIELAQFPDLRSSIVRHQPLRAALLTLAGAPAIAGHWQIDAAPHFAPQGQRFTGYIGRFRRRTVCPATPQPAPPEADRLRQVLHELRTPVNAIQGFAEIIQQQLFGPTPHEYRALAAVIAADAARMLAGFEELERFARIDGNALELAPGASDLTACVNATVQRLKPHSEPRGSSFKMSGDNEALPLAIAPLDLERLCWRLLATLAANAAPGESLRIGLRRSGRHARMTMQLPAVLACLDDEALLHAAADPAASLSAGMFGTGFALRLAASEASAGGGRLERKQESLNLLLPISPQAAHTLAQGAQAN